MSILSATTLAHYKWKATNPQSYTEAMQRYQKSPKGRETRRRNRAQLGPVRDARLVRQREQMRVYRLGVRNTVLAAYGNKCACCGEANKGFLTVDHIDGNVPELAETGKKLSGWVLYNYLIAHDFPPGYQCLCANCNMGIGWWGTCPHKKEPY